jgi:hypothetical protein
MIKGSLSSAYTRDRRGLRFAGQVQTAQRREKAPGNAPGSPVTFLPLLAALRCIIENDTRTVALCVGCRGLTLVPSVSRETVVPKAS